MTDLVLQNDILSMTSLEIAKLTGKQHSHVLVDIDNMFISLEINWVVFTTEYKDASGKRNRMYNLDRENCEILISWYSPKLRQAIIRRWRQLEEEKKNSFKIPTTLSGALMLAAKQAEVIENQTIQIWQLEKTKAYISDKKTATALGKLWGVTKELNKVKKKKSEIEKELHWAKVIIEYQENKEEKTSIWRRW